MMTLLLIALALQAPAPGPSFGVVDRDAAGQFCLAMEGPPLRAGSTVTIVTTEQPQRAFVATVTTPSPQCSPLEKAMIAGPYYLLSLPQAASPDSGLLVAVNGALPWRRVDRRTVSIRFDRRYPNLQVRSCTSSEGVHLTAWSGTPLRSRRLWHEYYYVPYDTEPSCDERDIPKVE